MKLHHHPGSANARKSRLAAHVAGVDVELVLVDVFAGAHKSPAYLKLNPNGMVPTLEDGDFVLWESNAIAQYLASQKPNSAYPQDAKTRADISRWQCWDLAHWTPAVQALVFERMFKKLANLGAPDPAAIEKGLTSFHRYAKVLDDHLTVRDFLVGKDLTLADLSIACGLTYAKPAEIPYESYANVKQWFSRIESLEAWKATAPPF